MTRLPATLNSRRTSLKVLARDVSELWTRMNASGGGPVQAAKKPGPRGPAMASFVQLRVRRTSRVPSR